MATANPIKLPVVITADGTQAQAGFAKLRSSMQGLERGFGRYLTRQASSLTGMVSGFFTVDALFSGIQKLLAHGAEVNERIAQFSPEVIKAQAELDVAKMEQDIQTASQMGPQQAQVLKLKQAALPEMAVGDVFAADLSNRFQRGLVEVKKQASRLATGDFGEFADVTWRKLKENFGFVDEMQLREEQLQNVRNIAPMPAPNLPPEQQPKEVQESAEQIRILSQQLREQRALSRQLGAN